MMTRMKKNDGEKGAECPDDTSTVEMEENVNDIKDENNEIYDEEKQAEFLDYTSPDDMEECVSDRNDDNNEKKQGKRG